jgi:hypothetical protein
MPTVMGISKDAFKAANRRAADRLQNTPIATGARYDRSANRVVIALSSGIEVAFAPRHAQGIERAKPHQLDKIEITPSGLGIHFPKLDADLYLPALLEGFLGSRRWIAAQMGRIGGKASTKAKSTAARRNGRLGGRPRKIREPA